MKHPAVETAEISISDQIDCRVAQATARKFAEELGFPPKEIEEIALVTSELATNLVRHAGSGTLSFEGLIDHDPVGIQIESQDRGPGITDVEQSLTDGFSTRGGLGLGLGSVNRLMDELEINSTPGLGTRIACRRWKRPAKSLYQARWDVGVATRSRRDAPANGDAYIVKEWNESLLVGVIDGLGHGEPAQKAAIAAQRYVIDHFDRPLESICEGVNRACRATRGVVMALARFTTPSELEFVNHGNIEIRAWSGDERRHFIARRGIFGAEPQEVKVQRHDWQAGWILALHSDGLDPRWTWENVPDFHATLAQPLATHLLRRFDKDEDDATVVVVKT